MVSVHDRLFWYALGGFRTDEAIRDLSRAREESPRSTLAGDAAAEPCKTQWTAAHEHLSQHTFASAQRLGGRNTERCEAPKGGTPEVVAHQVEHMGCGGRIDLAGQLRW